MGVPARAEVGTDAAGGLCVLMRDIHSHKPLAMLAVTLLSASIC